MGAGRNRQNARGGVVVAQDRLFRDLQRDAARRQRFGRHRQRIGPQTAGACKMLGRAVHGIDIVVAVVEELGIGSDVPFV